MVHNEEIKDSLTWFTIVLLLLVLQWMKCGNHWISYWVWRSISEWDAVLFALGKVCCLTGHFYWCFFLCVWLLSLCFTRSTASTTGDCMKQAAPPNTEKNTEMYFICEKWNTTNTTNMKLKSSKFFWYLGAAPQTENTTATNYHNLTMLRLTH